MIKQLNINRLNRPRRCLRKGLGTIRKFRSNRSCDRTCGNDQSQNRRYKSRIPRNPKNLLKNEPLRFSFRPPKAKHSKNICLQIRRRRWQLFTPKKIQEIIQSLIYHPTNLNARNTKSPQKDSNSEPTLMICHQSTMICHRSTMIRNQSTLFPNKFSLTVKRPLVRNSSIGGKYSKGARSPISDSERPLIKTGSNAPENATNNPATSSFAPSRDE